MEFPIDSMKKRLLLEGIDEIDYTFQLVSKITDYENKFSPKVFLNESKK
jgi:3-isopropylmalate dehydratase small subunit